ncbi:MAG: hypothetical protein Q9188_002027 [Gyalolechia gomerana]
MFDYHIEENDVDLVRWTNRLGDYHDRTWVREFRKGRLLPKLEDHFPAPSEDTTRFRDFLHQHSNLGGPLLPTSNVRPAVQEADSASVPQGDFPILRPQRTRPSSDKDTVNEYHKRNSLGFTGLSQASNAVDNADNNNKLPTKVVDDKPGRDDQGYFGLPRHDLALLAPARDSMRSKSTPVFAAPMFTWDPVFELGQPRRKRWRRSDMTVSASNISDSVSQFDERGFTTPF